MRLQSRRANSSGECGSAAVGAVAVVSLVVVVAAGLWLLLGSDSEATHANDVAGPAPAPATTSAAADPGEVGPTLVPQERVDRIAQALSDQDPGELDAVLSPALREALADTAMPAGLPAGSKVVYLGEQDGDDTYARMLVEVTPPADSDVERFGGTWHIQLARAPKDGPRRAVWQMIGAVRP